MDVKPHYTSEKLKAFFRTEKDPRLARRIHGVYLAGKGLTCSQIMAVTGDARRTIQQWVRKYNKYGIVGLKEQPRPGQPTKLSREKEFAFCKRIEAGPTGKDGVYVFNGVAIRRILEKEFGASYSLWGIYHLLNRLGYSCLCPRPQHEKANPQLQEQFKKTSSKRWIRSNQNIPTKK